VVQNEDGVAGEAVEVTVDGHLSGDGGIRLVDDGARHDVTVRRIPADIREEIARSRVDPSRSLP
jgi:hypothetical protein